LYLKRITVTGFKSFANKTVLDLEPGITAVVGPNGSGKSNIADAIRWALGEQSKTRLRLADREEVIFAGTAARAKASFAEVVLVFNNDDGVFPLDLTEIEISRRLYRSGEAEYRLAGRSARLADIQALLAEAHLGAGSYAVIGQGMIDTLLMSSPAERKLLFDEAAGIRGPELSREAAVRKLAATSANLVRLRDIATELAPRLSTLQSTAVTPAELTGLRERVTSLRIQILAASWARLTAQQATAAADHERLTAELANHRAEQSSLERRLQAAAAAARAATDEQARLQKTLAGREQERDTLAARLAETRAALAAAESVQADQKTLAAHLQEARAAHAAALERLAELQAEQSAAAESERRALRTLEKANRDVTAAQAELVSLRKQFDDGSRDQYLDHALHILKLVAANLSQPATTLPPASLEQTRLLVHKAGRLLSHATRTGAAELLAGVKSAQKRLESAMTRRETAVEHQTNITITARSLEIDRAHQEVEVERTAERIEQLESELTAATATAETVPTLAAGAKTQEAGLATLTRELEAQRQAIVAASAAPAASQQHLDAAAALERTRAAMTAVDAQLSATKAAAGQAKTALGELKARAKAWGLPLPPVPAPASGTVASPAPAAVPAPVPQPDRLDDLQSQLIRAETLLETRSALAGSQSAELEQISTRHLELTAQITDLESAGANLQSVIRELDAVIRSRFRDNFQALSEQFSTYFAQLFEGGSASLSLSEDAEGNYGIAIKASPKGKRLTAITALSGGERAMAGVALIAAILRVNPSPFIVLDEIDAALDEANSGRLAAILTELAQASQLIVVTHNRQTMRTARVLYGVTLSEHHVSHLVSLRLDEATALAAR
jgi:chromosome segregation protein